MTPLVFAVFAVLVLAFVFFLFRRVVGLIFWIAGLAVFVLALGFLLSYRNLLPIEFPIPVDDFLSAVEVPFDLIFEIVDDFSQFFSGVFGVA